MKPTEGATVVKLERQRHVSFQVIPVDGELVEFSEKTIAGHIWEVFLRVFGEASAADAGIWVEEYDTSTGFGILRCTNKVALKVIAALALLREIRRGESVPVRVVVPTLKMSGTIKALKKKKQIG
ncbi:MAG: Rpp14/Pop5 family protein [Promethearchaeota archaeon]